MATYYTKVLTPNELLGKKDCEIIFYTYKDSFEGLCKDAAQRNIKLTHMPHEEYCYRNRLTNLTIEIMRRITGASLISCKKVLERTNGDIDEAIKLLVKNKEFL